MLGLGSGLCGEAAYSSDISSPLDFSGCKLWLRHRVGIFATLDTDGETIDHSTSADNMADGDKINHWGDQSGEGNNATQETEADRALWVAGSNSVNYGSGKYMDLRANISEGSNSDFTFVLRGTISGVATAMTFFGNSGNDFWRINSGGKVIRTKIGGSTASDFTESTALETDVLYTFTLTRSGGDGTLEIRVHGGSSVELEDHQWGGTTRTDTDAFTVSNLGSSANDSNGWRGIIKHAIYYNAALTTDQRNELQVWLSNND